MDNLTHSLAGWALAETGLKRRTRLGTAACVLAANMPDIDVFFGWAPWAPLAMHRGFTHGLVGGVLLMPPLLAALLWLWGRRRPETETGPPLRFGWLVALCYLGALTHPLLDLQNVYAVQLFSPLSARWFHSDGLFIVSPWLLAMLGAGIWRARRSDRGRAAVAALAGCMAFIALNIGISALAWAAPESDAPYARPDRVFAAPEPLVFWRRDVVWRQDGAIVHGRFDPLVRVTGLVAFGAPVPDRMADPVVREASVDPVARRFLDWSQMPVAKLARDGECTRVTFGDARFSGPAMSRNFNVSVRVCPKVQVPERGAGVAQGHDDLPFDRLAAPRPAA
ncbi:metal-dependent hydrolase [Novosphingobium cyanobacteriorum]|uniref:Metal-dependent hydrolase n=1 Tax=Novosphingobium cyanobacteriorum TaxID=3024215 RepID=A0ABT6CJ94_9SPHN|nr:metal-dependent hydrolase [Novosphingobium cyanobacteriorum]MDF8333897.1 metal-dependent hydrolase [Novosphingobium cyanobacteriorum]